MRGAGSPLAGAGGKEHGDGTSDGAVHTGKGSKRKEGWPGRVLYIIGLCLSLLNKSEELTNVHMIG